MMLHFPAAIAGNIFMFYINSLKKMYLGNINNATIHVLGSWIYQPTFSGAGCCWFRVAAFIKIFSLFLEFSESLNIVSPWCMFCGKYCIGSFSRFPLEASNRQYSQAQSALLHFTIWTNIFCSLDKYI